MEMASEAEAEGEGVGEGGGEGEVRRERERAHAHAHTRDMRVYVCMYGSLRDRSIQPGGSPSPADGAAEPDAATLAEPEAPPPLPLLPPVPASCSSAGSSSSSSSEAACRSKGERLAALRLRLTGRSAAVRR